MLHFSETVSLLSPKDLWDFDFFLRYRGVLWPLIRWLKNRRRLPLGQHSHVLWENALLWWWQVQEMLRIEKGGESQAVEELETYNLLIPKAGYAVLTWSLEFQDRQQRQDMLRKLYGVQQFLTLSWIDEGETYHQAIEEMPYYRQMDQEENGNLNLGPLSAHSLYFMEVSLMSWLKISSENIQKKQEKRSWYFSELQDETSMKHLEMWIQTYLKTQTPLLESALPSMTLRCTHPLWNFSTALPDSLSQELAAEAQGQWDWMMVLREAAKGLDPKI